MTLKVCMKWKHTNVQQASQKDSASREMQTEVTMSCCLVGASQVSQ